MTITEDQKKDLENAALPLIEWMRENCPHPHMTVVVDRGSVELMEGIAHSEIKE